MYGETEKIAVKTDSNEPLSIKFTSIDMQSPAYPAAAVETQSAPSAKAPAEVCPKNAPRKGEPVPQAAIKIDGNFDDWNGILPTFTHAGWAGKKNLATSKVYLAIDNKTLYMRLDVADSTASSFFHPYNFSTDDNSSYGLD